MDHALGVFQWLSTNCNDKVFKINDCSKTDHPITRSRAITRLQAR